MKKAKRTMRIRGRINRGTFRACVRPRWLLVTIAALLCWIAFAVRNGAQQVDSGWAVAIPSPVAHNSTPATPEQQIVIRHVLEHIQPPLRKSNSGQAAQSTTD